MRPWVMLALATLTLSLTAGCTCAAVDTGYRPDPHGFGFPNAGDGGLLGTGLGAPAVSFHDEVLSHTGHCYGMARASVESFLKGGTSIDVPMADVMAYIDRVQTEQSFYYFFECLRPPFGDKTADNAREYAKVLGRLAAGRPAVIGVYPSGGTHPGHAVVAYRIEGRERKAYIYVYDPNFPATAHDYDASPLLATFDEDNGTFSYDNGKAFDLLRLDEIGDAQDGDWQVLLAQLLALPGTVLVLLMRRARSPPRP